MVYDPKTRTTVKPAAKPEEDPARPKQAASKKAETDEPQRARDGSLTFEGVRLTHPDRILYPGTSLTKLDVARYYAAVSDWALPRTGAPAFDFSALAGGRHEDVLSETYR